MVSLLRFLFFISLAHSCISFGWRYSIGKQLASRVGLRSTEIDTTGYTSAELTEKGLASRSKGELNEALRFLQAAVKKNPNNFAAHLNLSLVAKEQDNLSLAADSLSRAVDLKSNDDDLKYDLGSVLAKMGYIDDAEAIFRNLLLQEPQQREHSQPQEQSKHLPKAKIALTNLLLDGRGQRLKAFEVFRDASDPGPSPLALLAGVAADSLGYHSAAMSFYEDSWKENEADEYAMTHLMISYLRQGHDKMSNAVAPLRKKLPSFIVSSVDYVLSTSVGMKPSMHYFTYDMLKLALENTSIDMEEEAGLILEFGVYHGKTIRMIASYFPNDPVHGFDTFSGIPEDWHNTGVGSYSTFGILPEAPDNVKYHIGLFSETLSEFLSTHPGPIRLMNIDCDLYSSTKDVFDVVADRVRPGTVIIFDEYVMNPHWENDEFKAFQEAVVKYGWEYKYLGISLVSQQAVIQII